MKNIELISQYLNHEMQEVDRLAFEKSLEQDPELAKAFVIQKIEYEALQQAAFPDLHEKIFKAKVEPATVSRRMFSKSIYYTLAAALVLLLAGTYYIMSKGNSDSVPNRIAEEQPGNSTPVKPVPPDSTTEIPGDVKPPSGPSATPGTTSLPVDYQSIAMGMVTDDPSGITVRSGRNEGRNAGDYAIWESASVFFEKGNYDSLNLLIETLPKDYVYAADVHFLHAYSLLKRGQFESAYQQLFALQEVDDAFQKERNRYYLLLAGIGRLPKGKRETMRLLEAITSDKRHMYIKEARVLQNRLAE
ncbi:MAG: hypothetical protein AB8F95_21455 [Bacteroidia bacterium]